ncbi:MAG: biotin--[acetyl-CoA-carboxylase] ligase [Xanthobacteraceae bacterium]|uniref:biotin--[acetyl-CoA-carboxylase] ligase n=1 Tax=Pseudolabrys sp. TaxID=1960880 RepID=UPI003D13F469
MIRDATDPAEVRHLSYDTLGSTNAEALVLARAGERGPVWITAKTQSAGRGRRGKDWVSPPGNLYATLLLTEPAPSPRAAQLSFVAGLAVRDAVAACAGSLGGALTLKWPNDVLIGGRKIAGLLIEAENAPVFSVAIGIGVNCISHPDGTAYPAADLAGEGARVSMGALFAALVPAMQARLAQWQGGANFPSIRRDWLKYAAGLGEFIQVRLPERELYGRFMGLDENGRLLVQPETGPHLKITAGEVFGFGVPKGAG